MRPLVLPSNPMRRRLLKGAATGVALAGLPGLALSQARRLDPAAKPTLYAHRGASALRPEHTLAAYARAIADTTDVATRAGFASRKTRKVIDGEAHEGWFVSDFTLAELSRPCRPTNTPAVHL